MIHEERSRGEFGELIKIVIVYTNCLKIKAEEWFGRSAFKKIIIESVLSVALFSQETHSHL